LTGVEVRFQWLGGITWREEVM